jgi:hypothetical protein
MAHIAGFGRDQLLLLPEAVDDYVEADNSVRFHRRVCRRGDRQNPADRLDPSSAEFLKLRQRSVIAASPQAEVAGGHSVNADEQRDEPERSENILGHCFLLDRP